MDIFSKVSWQLFCTLFYVFGMDGAFEIRPVLDHRAKSLLEDDRNLYLEMQITPQPGATGTVEFLGASGDQDPTYCFYNMNDLFQAVVYGGDRLAVGDQTDPPDIEVSTSAGVNDVLAIIDVLASPAAPEREVRAE